MLLLLLPLMCVWVCVCTSLSFSLTVYVCSFRVFVCISLARMFLPVFFVLFWFGCLKLDIIGFKPGYCYMCICNTNVLYCIVYTYLCTVVAVIMQSTFQIAPLKRITLFCFVQFTVSLVWCLNTKKRLYVMWLMSFITRGCWCVSVHVSMVFSWFSHFLDWKIWFCMKFWLLLLLLFWFELYFKSFLSLSLVYYIYYI